MWLKKKTSKNLLVRRDLIVIRNIKSKIKKVIKNNDTPYVIAIYNVICSIRNFFKYTFGHIRCSIQKNIRKKSNKKYDNLRSLKNIHKGERCFIVCTGPSLSISDLEMLKNEYTFGVNNVFRLFDKTSWRPTYYGIIDPSVFEKLSDDPVFRELENVFIPDLFEKMYKKISIKQYRTFPMDYYELYWRKLVNKPVRFSDDISLLVYDIATVAYSLMQIAVYMGFEEIYLLGCDCDYSGEKQHFADYGIKVDDAFTTENNLMVAFSAARKYADSHGIKIFNATRGGKLEIFERVDFDSLFDKNK